MGQSQGKGCHSLFDEGGWALDLLTPEWLAQVSIYFLMIIWVKRQISSASRSLLPSNTELHTALSRAFPINS
ncbi:hypothetical protein DPEC_G00174220 [Dallia pectoralis]|uniref:Uncharacterized protein n=1 Tax=Dallia pectoralis TaxID=75939 RepID=A0ACC2GE55_DALPE|nr:hypothetical protein DPEC_G00174220 [Dallia pectoralis]